MASAYARHDSLAEDASEPAPGAPGHRAHGVGHRAHGVGSDVVVHFAAVPVHLGGGGGGASSDGAAAPSALSTRQASRNRWRARSGQSSRFKACESISSEQAFRSPRPKATQRTRLRYCSVSMFSLSQSSNAIVCVRPRDCRRAPQRYLSFPRGIWRLEAAESFQASS